MDSRKTVIRLFTVADYENEEVWLSNQHKNGWRLLRVAACFFIFEKCTPEDVVYRLDYKNNAGKSDYFQILGDYGWEYIDQCLGWMYFRKSVSSEDSEQDCELFSDNETRVDLINHVIKTRLLPILIVFLACVLPNLGLSITTGIPAERVFTVIFSVITGIYLYLLIHCGWKLRKMKKKYHIE